jgi:prephenate dehydratase
MIVGYQGEPGAFSDEAARSRFDNPETRGYSTFEQVVAAVAQGQVDCALLPVENSIVGPIADARNALCGRSDVRTVGTIDWPIVQCLLGVPGARVAGLVQVQSHPVALAQCGGFLEANKHMSAVAAEDTAGAVRAIVEIGDRRIAAIGPASAADRYGAVVLVRNIADQRRNTTQFAIIARGAVDG